MTKRMVGLFLGVLIGAVACADVIMVVDGDVNHIGKP